MARSSCPTTSWERYIASGTTASKRAAVALSLLFAAGIGTPVLAGDAKAGRAKALACQACHGLDGVSKVPDAPNLAGQVEGYLVTQLRAFKSGARKSEAMSVVAATLSDQDIDNLAAYYAGIEVKLGRLPE
jgi:cytochrome c553